MARAQDRDPVAERLDLRQDVGRQEHRLATLAGIGHALAERPLHQRVQAARRLVEEQQIGPGHQPGDEDELLPIALGVRPDLLRRVELEPVDQQVPVRDVDMTLDATQQVQRLLARQRGPQVDLARHVRDAAMRLDGIGLAVDAEDLRPSRRRADQPQQQAERGRLPRAVRTQVAEHLALRYLDVQGHQRVRGAEGLRQILGSGRDHHQTLQASSGTIYEATPADRSRSRSASPTWHHPPVTC